MTPEYMGLLNKLFKSKELKQQEAKLAAKQEWSKAQASGDELAMQQASSSLSLARLEPEYLAAQQELIERFPTSAYMYENEIGVWFWGEGKYDQALQHYIRSYNLDEAGGCAEANILELCQQVADDEPKAIDAINRLLVFFRVCTKTVDPTATFEDITLMSIFREKPESLSEHRLLEAEGAFDQIEELLEEVEDSSFVQRTEQELKVIASYFGIERL